MLKKLVCMAISLTVCAKIVIAAEEFSEEQLARRNVHQTLLNAARSGCVETLNDLLRPTEGSSEKYIPTGYDTRELFNAAFISNRLHVMECLWAIPSLPDPVDFSYFGMEIHYPQTAVPYVTIKGFDDLNDIFSYNICSRTAFCHIYTPMPNTDRLENSRWISIFEFFKVAENAGQKDLVKFIVKKAYLYNQSSRPAELQKWIDFMREKAISQNCPTVTEALSV